MSIEDVAATLGIANTSVCNHVPSKSGILSGTTVTAQDSGTGEAPTPDAQRKLVIGGNRPWGAARTVRKRWLADTAFTADGRLARPNGAALLGPIRRWAALRWYFPGCPS